MQDRFKFRVWDVENKCFIDLCDIYLDCLSGKILTQHYDCNSAPGYYGEPYEISQCTGLKDKHGKLIYEGDILESIYYLEIFPEIRIKDHLLVYWAEGNASFALEHLPFSKDEREFGIGCSSGFTIIGNQWENPELWFVNSELMKEIE